jgi:alpha-beta hydrolase superfamily lysophospholipase
MNSAVKLFLTLAVFGSLFFSSISSTSYAGAPDKDKAIVSHDTEVSGVRLHYMTAGHGPAVILLHGYAETSRMWRPLMPLLAERFTVFAPDLPGIGDSAIPADGLDMKTVAIRIHARSPVRSAWKRQEWWAMTSD